MAKAHTAARRATAERLVGVVAPPTNGATNGAPASAGGFEVTEYYAAETAEVVLRHPVTGADTSGRITVRSMHARVARTATRAMQAKLVDGKTELSTEDWLDSLFEQTVAATVSWNITVHGEPLPCTPETVRAMYSDPKTAWMQPQVQAVYIEIGHFFGSAKPSS
jgi:hypothetical protein